MISISRHRLKVSAKRGETEGRNTIYFATSQKIHETLSPFIEFSVKKREEEKWKRWN